MIQSNERQIADVLIVFIEPEAQETNSFVDGGVRECHSKFSSGNFNRCVVNLRIVYTSIVLFVVKLRQTEAFTFLKRSYENMYVFIVMTCNNLIG